MLAWRKRSAGQQDTPTYEDQPDHEYANDYHNYDQEDYYRSEGGHRTQPQMRPHPQAYYRGGSSGSGERQALPPPEGHLQRASTPSSSFLQRFNFFGNKETGRDVHADQRGQAREGNWYRSERDYMNHYELDPSQSHYQSPRDSAPAPAHAAPSKSWSSMIWPFGQNRPVAEHKKLDAMLPAEEGGPERYYRYPPGSTSYQGSAEPNYGLQPPSRGSPYGVPNERRMLHHGPGAPPASSIASSHLKTGPIPSLLVMSRGAGARKISLKLVVPLVACLVLLYIMLKTNSGFSASGLLNRVKDSSPTRKLKSTSTPADFYFELREQPKGLIAESLTASKKRAQTQKFDLPSSRTSQTSIEPLPKTTTMPLKESIQDESSETKPAPLLDAEVLSHIALKAPKASSQTSEAKDEKSEQELIAQYAAKKRVVSRYMYDASSESSSKKKDTTRS